MVEKKKFWLNGKLLQEDAYFIEFKKNLAKQSEEVSPYRPPRVEYLTAEEIENLINGAGIVIKRVRNAKADNAILGYNFLKVN